MQGENGKGVCNERKTPEPTTSRRYDKKKLPLCQSVAF